MIVTIDAMGCQKKIVKKTVDKKAEYLIALNDNQSSLHKGVKDFFHMKGDEEHLKEYDMQQLKMPVGKDHGRIETRPYTLCTNVKWVGNMVYNEDYRGNRKDNSRQSRAVIRKIAVNPVKTVTFSVPCKKKKLTVRNTHMMCSTNETCLLDTLALL